MRHSIVLFVLLLAVFSWGSSCSSHRKDVTKVTLTKNNKLPGKKVKIMEIKDNECVEVTVRPEFQFQFVEMAPISKVFELAGNLDKLVYLDINAKWCLPCKLMQRDVYTHKETAAFFNDNFISYMVDMESGEGPDLKLIYEINTLPTLLWLDSNGRVVHRKEGACYQEELIKNARIALKSVNR